MLKMFYYYFFIYLNKIERKRSQLKCLILNTVPYRIIVVFPREKINKDDRPF